MTKLDSIVDQVLHNCDISDAQHAGLYSICGLALRLRDLFKWEKRLPPWQEKEPCEVLDWIGKKEQLWGELENQKYQPIKIGNRLHDPFDTDGINASLAPINLYYGAGYARSLKPTFFLAAIDQRRVIQGHTVYILGRELARDLLTIPALNQDQAILLRKESAQLYLWDQITYVKKSGRPALDLALDCCGLTSHAPETLQKHFEAIFQAQMETYIYHELGELQEHGFDPHAWRELLFEFARTPIELLARAVKDLLADTSDNGTLRHIISHRQTAALAFYVAFFDGLGKVLFPELISGFELFAAGSNWQALENIVTTAYHSAKTCARHMLDIFNEGKQRQDSAWCAAEMDRRLLAPLLAGSGRSPSVTAS
jgi:hypothetical protein